MRQFWGGITIVGILISMMLIITSNADFSAEIVFLWTTITIVILSVIVFKSPQI